MIGTLSRVRTHYISKPFVYQLKESLSDLAICLKLHKLYIKCQNSEDITKILKSQNLNIAFIKTMFFCPNGEINANSYQELIKNYQNGITMRYGQFRFIRNKE
jgi:hypothetical protein